MYTRLFEIMEQREKKVNTALGQITLTDVEPSETDAIMFYINISEVSDTWKDVIEKAVEVGKLSHEESKRYGWTWSNAGVIATMRLQVVIHPNWKISTALEVFYQDKEKDYLFGTVYFDVNIPDEVLTEIIIDAIRDRLFQQIYRKRDVNETIL